MTVFHDPCILLPQWPYSVTRTRLKEPGTDGSGTLASTLAMSSVTREARVHRTRDDPPMDSPTLAKLSGRLGGGLVICLRKVESGKKKREEAFLGETRCFQLAAHEGVIRKLAIPALPKL
jgi:hypothetical protein